MPKQTLNFSDFENVETFETLTRQLVREPNVVLPQKL